MSEVNLNSVRTNSRYMSCVGSGCVCFQNYYYYYLLQWQWESITKIYLCAKSSFTPYNVFFVPLNDSAETIIIIRWFITGENGTPAIATACLPGLGKNYVTLLACLAPSCENPPVWSLAQLLSLPGMLEVTQNPEFSTQCYAINYLHYSSFWAFHSTSYGQLIWSV